MLIRLVLKTPLVGLVSSVVSVVVLFVASGTTLFPEFFSGNKFCVASGNLGADRVFVVSGIGKSGGGNGVFGRFDTPVSLVSFLGVSFTSGNADEALHLVVLLSSISFCRAIRVAVRKLLLSNGHCGFSTSSKSLSFPLSFTPCSV